ncbi:MAG: FAD-dependent oxidoreductase [Eubacterium sp.]|nr:FAD-dependent oxidoreductase [Eubacterium sp.]
MDTRLDSLFTPWKVGKAEIKNRIVLTSMGGTNLFGWMENNHFDKDGARFILKVAKNNVGLLLPGCQPVYNPIMGQWLYKNKKMYQELAKWMPEFHKTGAKLFIQLTAGFGRSFTVSEMMEKLYTNPALRRASKPFMDLDRITATASEAPNRWSDKVPSREMTVREIHEMVDAFVKTAALLKQAGVDGVEIHAVHEGYLLDQFSLPYVNHRADEYGGSLENRLRFTTEIIQGIKKACGDDFPVSLRYSAVSHTKGFRRGALPEEDGAYEEAGRTLKESEQAVKILEDAGCDMFNCDNGTYDAWYWAHPPIYMPEGCNLKDVEHIKRFTSKPVVCAGRMDPYTAAVEIGEGRLDAAGFARNFLADQEWVTKLINGRKEDIRPCILCHSGCFNMGHFRGVSNDQSLEDSLHLSRCAVNAETMQWDKHHIKRTNHPKKVAIIGGGIGGMEAARVLKLRGHEPVIYEKGSELGGTFIAASSESYKGRLRSLLEWYKKQMKDLDIEIHLNTEIKSLDELPDGEKIIATGSTPRILRKVSGFEKTIEACDFLLAEKAAADAAAGIEENMAEAGEANYAETAEAPRIGAGSGILDNLAVNGRKVGKTIAVIGGGLTGCEIAYEIALLGGKPIIIEMKDDLVSQRGVCLANSSYLREYFALHKIPVYLEATLKEVKDGSIVVVQKSGGRSLGTDIGVHNSYAYAEEAAEKVLLDGTGDLEIEIPCDSVISSAGYLPAPLGTGNRKKGIHFVGDCSSVGNLRTVIWGAYEAAMQI